MKNADFEKLLKQSLQANPKKEENLNWENTLLLARLQVRQIHQRKRIPFRQFLCSQIRYIGWRLWGAQGLMLLLFDRVLTQLYGERFWDSPSSVARLLFCLSTLIAMIALPLLHRSQKYRMQEIESASCFSSCKLLMAKLAVIGIGDTLLLAGTFLTTVLRTSMEAGSLTFYLFLPFLIMCAAYLYMMGHCRGSRFFAGSIALGTAMLVVAVMLPGRWLPTFQEGIPWGISFFCFGLLAFSAQQLRYLLYRSPYPELQIT